MHAADRSGRADLASIPTLLVEYPIVCLDKRKGQWGCVTADEELGRDRSRAMQVRAQLLADRHHSVRD
eukprot:COSAG05_NODE_2018_length_3687_cov_38.539091_3_plen_68_part_00